MLEKCCSHHASLQSTEEQRNEKQSFDAQSYKDFAGLDSFDQWFYPHDSQYDEFKPKWESVLKSYIGPDGSVVMLNRLLQHVLTSRGGDSEVNGRFYKEAVARVEKQAKALYVEEDISISKCSQDEFLQVMTEQGCFILQLALCSLSGPELLGYPHDDDLLFGKNRWNNKVIKFLVNRYVFSIKNQIPLVVLKVLMKQSFFQTILNSRKWKRPNDLARIVLYEFLVEPMLPVKRNRRWHQQQPITLRHALWLLLTGPDSISHGRAREEGDHLYTNFPTVRSAVELQAAGITFKSEERMGMREIKFKKTMLGGYLYLPCIYMEPETMQFFQKVINDEVQFELDKNRRAVSAFVNLMKELIRSSEDVKVLVVQGIIQTDPEYEQQLQAALLKLQTSEVGSNHNLVTIRHQIHRYVKPSTRKRIVNLVVIGVILTLVQTIFSLLSYIHPLGHS